MALTEAHDLRGGAPTWADDAWPLPPADALPTAPVDIAIIGAGIMGSVLAERLSADGHSILSLDRRPPGMGSTAASTAELMWAMDVPLCTLAEKIGEDEAARRWVRVYQAVRQLADRIDDLAIDCARRDRPTVYLAGQQLDEAGLQAEARLHKAHGLPSAYLDSDAAGQRFGITPRAALVSDGGFEVDPVKLAHGLLEIARKRGARVCYPADAVSLAEEDDGVTITLETGERIRAGKVILAGGYERALLFLPPEFALLSTFVMATAPGVAPLWRENAMIWEASDPYLYIRIDAEGRIIAGGEDEDYADSDHRNAMIGQKAATIAVKVAALLGSAPLAVDRAWAATFGSAPDGLPAIGRAANMDKVWLSAGFGGNGIAFAALASDLLAAAFAGRADPDAACFDPYRFATAS
jgi:glycine/D-amino acid oxidase-like deaminating enzyme